MRTVLRGRGLCLALAGVMLASLAAPARGDDFQHLPDRPHIAMSMNLQAFLKSKVYQGLKDAGIFGREDMEAMMERQMGVPARDIVRATMAVNFGEDKGRREDSVGVISVSKPVTAAAIRASKKPSSKFMVNYKFDEIKVGSSVIYQESFQFQFNEKEPPQKAVTGQAFTVVDQGKTILYGRLESLQKVLERNKAAELSDSFKAGLKHVPLTNAAILVMDLQNMPEREKNDMLRGLPFLNLKEVLGGVQSFAASLNEADGKTKGSAIAICKDAAAAGAAKDAVANGLTLLRRKLEDGPKGNPKVEELVKQGRALLDAIKTSTSGNEARAEMIADPAAVIGFFRLLAFAEDRPEPVKKETK